MTPINGNEKTKKNKITFAVSPFCACVCCYCFLHCQILCCFSFCFFSFRPLERNILSCGLAYSFGFSLFSRMELNMK